MGSSDRSPWPRPASATLLCLSSALSPTALIVQREQFILVNKAKPLPTRLINELLPETGGIVLPRDLSARKVPSEFAAC